MYLLEILYKIPICDGFFLFSCFFLYGLSKFICSEWVYSKGGEKPWHALVLNLDLPTEKHLRCGRGQDFSTAVMSSEFFFFLRKKEIH